MLSLLLTQQFYSLLVYLFSLINSQWLDKQLFNLVQLGHVFFCHITAQRLCMLSVTLVFVRKKLWLKVVYALQSPVFEMVLNHWIANRIVLADYLHHFGFILQYVFVALFV